jgi:hypothetical protein
MWKNTRQFAHACIECTRQQLELLIRSFTQNIQDVSGTRGLVGIGFVSFRNWERESNQNLTSHYQISVLERIKQHC